MHCTHPRSKSFQTFAKHCFNFKHKFTSEKRKFFDTCHTSSTTVTNKHVRINIPNTYASTERERRENRTVRFSSTLHSIWLAEKWKTHLEAWIVIVWCYLTLWARFKTKIAYRYDSRYTFQLPVHWCNMFRNIVHVRLSFRLKAQKSNKDEHFYNMLLSVWTGWARDGGLKIDPISRKIDRSFEPQRARRVIAFN